MTAAVRGVIDILDLVSVRTDCRNPESHPPRWGLEGGLVTTLAVENHPGVFSGGMAMWTDRDFREQVNYWGDFPRAVRLLPAGSCRPAQSTFRRL
jgi:hypothetical protein